MLQKAKTVGLGITPKIDKSQFVCVAMLVFKGSAL